MYLIDFIKVCLKNKKMVLLYPILAGLIAIGIASILPKTYYSEIRVKIDDSNSSMSGGVSLGGGSSAMSSLLGISGASAEQADFYLEIMTSREIMVQAIKKFKLDSVYKKTSIDMTLKSFSKDFSADIDDNGIIFCGFQQDNQDFVKELVTFFVEKTNERYMFLQKERLKYSTEFTRHKKERFLDSLNALNDELSQFYKENNLVNLESQLTLSLGALAGYEQQLSALKIEKDYNGLNNNNKDLTYKRYEDKINVLKTQFRKIRGSKSKNYKPGRNSVYLNADWAIEKFQYEQTLVKQIKMVAEILEIISQELVISEAKLTRNQAVAQIVQDAYRPDWKVKPKRAVWAISASVITFFFLVSFVLFRAFLKGEIGDNEEIRKALNDLISDLSKKS